MKSVLQIGNRANDSVELKKQKTFLVAMALLMSGGGILWGSIAFAYDYYLQGMIPYGYTIVTLLNLTLFYFTKKFKVVRFIQILFSLLLPFLFQWSLGGFKYSGAMMLWAMLALVGSMTFENIQSAYKWLIAYLVFTILSGIIDMELKEWAINRSDSINSLFFVINVVAVSSAVFGLVFYFKKESEDSNEALKKQKKQVEDAFVKVEKANKNINASINYAQRIQEATLPTDGYIKKSFSDSFVYFKPKDIVSGDFYWASDIPENNNIKLIAAVDCTGHGVPGAFMSMLGNTYLNKIAQVQRIAQPNEILETLDQDIKKALKQSETNNKDGMDMSLCMIDKKEKVLSFSGAKNPLIYIQNNQLHLIKGDRRSIGESNLIAAKRDFQQHKIKLDEPTIVYLFSDGIQDQFDSGNKKKYSIKRLKEFLYEIYMQPMETQKKLIEKEILYWMGNSKQIDDMLIIGLKIDLN